MLVLLAALALAVSDPPGDDAAASLDGLQQLYDQSCASREYGAFDDLCDQLSRQLHEARAQAARDARRQAAEDRARPAKSAVAKTTGAPAVAGPATLSTPPAQLPR